MVPSPVKLLINFLSKSNFQRLLSKVHYTVLYSQGFGRSGDFLSSGETWIIRNIILKQITKNDIIFDVGANVGNYTKMIFSEQCPTEFYIYCFEPSKQTFQLLKNNLSEFTNLRLFNFAFGNTNSTSKLYLTTDSRQSSLMKRDNKHWGENYKQVEEEEVKVCTIDSFLYEQNLEEIFFLKIDAEGFELKILQGALNLVKNKKIRYIQFEFGVCMVDTRVFFKDFYNLLSENYHIYRILRNGIYKISEYDERHEVFLTTNYFCMKK